MSLSHEMWTCIRTAQELANHAKTIGLDYQDEDVRKMATALFIEACYRKRSGVDFTVGKPALYVVSPADLEMCVDAVVAMANHQGESGEGTEIVEQWFRLAHRLNAAIGNHNPDEGNETALGKHGDDNED